jgi:Protein of unknown function (DUF3365)
MNFHRAPFALLLAGSVATSSFADTPPEPSEAGPKIVAAAFAQLSAALGDALSLNVCSEKAPAIAAAVGREHGVTLRRATLRPRNPKNAADAREQQVLAAFAEAMARKEAPKPQTQREPDGSATFFAPIVLANPLCLQCHGKPGQEVAASTLTAIRAKYPEDKATGYALGELRGLWRVTFPSPTANPKP